MKSKVDACIFCDEVPCVCNAKPKPEMRTKAARSSVRHVTKNPDISAQTSAEQGHRKTSFQDAMKRAAAEAPPPPPPMPPPPKPKRPTPNIPDDELVMNAAIRNLAPLLHPDERERYGAIISSKPHPGERKAVWKMRRVQDGDIQ